MLISTVTITNFNNVNSAQYNLIPKLNIISLKDGPNLTAALRFMFDSKVTNGDEFQSRNNTNNTGSVEVCIVGGANIIMQLKRVLKTPSQYYIDKAIVSRAKYFEKLKKAEILPLYETFLFIGETWLTDPKPYNLLPSALTSAFEILVNFQKSDSFVDVELNGFMRTMQSTFELLANKLWEKNNHWTNVVKFNTDVLCKLRNPIERIERNEQFKCEMMKYEEELRKTEALCYDDKEIEIFSRWLSFEERLVLDPESLIDIEEIVDDLYADQKSINEEVFSVWTKLSNFYQFEEIFDSECKREVDASLEILEKLEAIDESVLGAIENRISEIDIQLKESVCNAEQFKRLVLDQKQNPLLNERPYIPEPRISPRIQKLQTRLDAFTAAHLRNQLIFEDQLSKNTMNGLDYAIKTFDKSEIIPIFKLIKVKVNSPLLSHLDEILCYCALKEDLTPSAVFDPRYGFDFKTMTLNVFCSNKLYACKITKTRKTEIEQILRCIECDSVTQNKLRILLANDQSHLHITSNDADVSGKIIRLQKWYKKQTKVLEANEESSSTLDWIYMVRHHLDDYHQYITETNNDFISKYSIVIEHVRHEKQRKYFQKLLEKIRAGNFVKYNDVSLSRSMDYVVKQNLSYVTNIQLLISEYSISIHLLDDLLLHPNVGCSSFQQQCLQLDKKELSNLKNRIKKLKSENADRKSAIQENLEKYRGKCADSIIEQNDNLYDSWRAKLYQSSVNIIEALGNLRTCDKLFKNIFNAFNLQFKTITRLAEIRNNLKATVETRAMTSTLRYLYRVMETVSGMYDLMYDEQRLLLLAELQKLEIEPNYDRTEYLGPTDFGTLTMEVVDLDRYEAVTAGHKYKLVRLLCGLSAALHWNCEIIVIEQMDGMAHLFDEFIKFFEMEIFQQIQIIIICPHK